MATSSYPAGLDNLVDPGPTQAMNDPTAKHDELHSMAHAAIEAVQRTLGTNPQGAHPTVRDRLASIGFDSMVSTSTVTIGTGTKVFAVNAIGWFIVGTRVRVVSVSDPATKWVEGTITDIDVLDVTVAVDSTAGSGSVSSWAFTVAGAEGAPGPAFDTEDPSFTGEVNVDEIGPVTPTDQKRTVVSPADVSMFAATTNGLASGGYSFYRSRGTLTVPAAVENNDYVAFPLYALAHDGTDYIEVGLVSLRTAGAPATGVVPVAYEMQFMDAAGALWSALKFLPDQQVLSDGLWRDIALDSPTVTGGWKAWGGELNYPTMFAPREGLIISGTGATGTINIDALDRAIRYITADATANWTINLRGNSDWSLDQVMEVGQAITFQVLATVGTTPYYATTIQVDGTTIAPKWVGGVAPAGGHASSINVYTLTAIKTGAATFTVLAAIGVFA